jgi:6-phosphogluconate dehydrogenase
MSNDMGLYGLGVMGQNLALNVASKGFQIAVCNRSAGRVDTCISRAKAEGLADNLHGFKDTAEFVKSLKRPRRVMFLVKAGQAVDDTIALFADLLEEGDIMIDGGNEWYENSERRGDSIKSKGILYLAMGVSGGEEGARNGPSMMPGGPREAYDAMHDILVKVAAQSDSGPCVTYLGEGGAGNYVKMVHNGIEYGDMQLISEAYDLLKSAGMNNEEIADTFEEWNKGELQSFLIEITFKILRKKDEDVMVWKDSSMLEKGDGYVVDKVLDATGNKGTGKMTIREGARLGVACGTMSAALDARFLAFNKEERVAADKILKGPSAFPQVKRDQLVEDIKNALYCSKICSYAQGMKLIGEASKVNGWGVDLGEAARIWKAGCIIRAGFLDRIKSAFERTPDLASLLVDSEFAAEINERQDSWRRIVTLSVAQGTTAAAMASSLAYYDQYRRARLPANLVQAQRDFFGSHTFERTDKPRGEAFHCLWDETHNASTGQ